MALSPMMQQYFNIKEENPGAILLFRVGDFYELYFDDAVTASKELDILLTGKDCGLEERAPMAGVPYHSITPYISKLVDKGYKVAICEQVSNPSESKGIVKREVVRVITAGTLIDSPLLEEEKNNYIASIFYDGDAIGVCWSDISTGEFNHATINQPVAVQLGDLLTKINPAEIICNSTMKQLSTTLSIVKYGMVCAFNEYDENSFDFCESQKLVNNQFDLTTATEIKKHKLCVCSAGALLDHLIKTQKRALTYINHTKLVNANDFMYVDYSARRNLELVNNTQDGGKKGSLLWVLDKTTTKMGARLLRKTILQPYQDENSINNILDGVEELMDDKLRAELTNAIKPVSDIERIVAKLSYNTIIPKESLLLATSLSCIKPIKAILSKTKSKILKNIASKLTDYSELYTKIFSAINPNAPSILKEGGVFNKGYDNELDHYTELKENADKIVEELAAEERLNTNLKNLKISNTRNFGYYIEVPKSQAELVPFRYIRKQTLKNAERYTTEELRNLETQIFSAIDNAVAREVALYESIMSELRGFVDPFLRLSQAIAELDMILSHAIVSKENGYCKPIVNKKVNELKVIDGRHPVVEKLLKGDSFVPNDINIDNNESHIMLITGPNMAGKSVYMRASAIVVIMAHIGCFISAKSGSIPITDKIFTRVGASDDQSTGRSTFMVEMSEVSNIIENMTDNSLLLLDEIGRGTSTYDGLSIAWSILEYLSQNTKAKVLFSTHYHELTELEGVLNGVKNYKLMLKEVNKSIIFMRKMMRGSANKSFGIEVASLSGLNKNIIARSKELLSQLEAVDIGKKAKLNAPTQVSLFDNNSGNLAEIKNILSELDVDSISPRNALDILTDLKEKVLKNG